MVWCAVDCCVALCCVLLCLGWAVLCCAVVCFAVDCCVLLCGAVRCCSVPGTGLHSTVQYCRALPPTIPLFCRGHRRVPYIAAVAAAASYACVHRHFFPPLGDLIALSVPFRCKAYEVLGDPEKKNNYDRFGHRGQDEGVPAGYGYGYGQGGQGGNASEWVRRPTRNSKVAT